MSPKKRDRSRRFDVVLWGATGFTGRLVAEYLAGARTKEPFRLALGGRNLDKLRSVRDGLAAMSEDAEDIELLVGDSHDRRSLDAIAKQTEVVCTTVGPFAEHGAELVAACVEHGTDYCDLTGEVPFMRRMIDAHHEAARRSGARIVHSCGFDSIPSDIGTLMLHDAFVSAYGVHPQQIRLYAGESRGGLSGGTVASMLGIIDEIAEDRSILKEIANPYALNPRGEQHGPDGRDQTSVRFDDAIGMWTGPFAMASVNTRVVRRTNALLGYRYGRDFRYSEVMSFGRGVRGLLRAVAVTGALGGFVVAARLGPARRILQRTVLPEPGDGPSRATRERGYFVIRLIARGRYKDGSMVTARGRVACDADPGYGATAKMLGQSALCLALDDARLEAEGGVGTPASTMGHRLLERLRKASMTFEVRVRA
jgi:short subunit dehydrogenase-like uncharacterized protein